MRVVAERREGCADDAFGEALVADRRDVIDAETAPALGDEHIFAALLQAVHPPARPLDDVAEFLERAALARALLVENPAEHPILQYAVILLDLQFPVIGIGTVLQNDADHRLRLVPFGPQRTLDYVSDSNGRASCMERVG